MSRNTFREQRRAARTARIRNRRIALTVILVAVVALVAYGIFSSLTPDEPQETALPTSAAEVITTESGLQYQDILIGEGDLAEPGKRVKVHYTGRLEDGSQFDSSIDRGQPFEFTLGGGGVIQGWEEGIAGMREGGQRILTIPPDLGYGEAGRPPVIPGNATLIFEVELVEVN
ncbi:MAG: FKBP-type peptidyl-prolyl cis-trans isomerase [Anaerolineales bacterium]|jgi:FKBP-type peptidyl-prolyl cis-trans isomerase